MELHSQGVAVNTIRIGEKITGSCVSSAGVDQCIFDDQVTGVLPVRGTDTDDIITGDCASRAIGFPIRTAIGTHLHQRFYRQDCRGETQWADERSNGDNS